MEKCSAIGKAILRKNLLQISSHVLSGDWRVSTSVCVVYDGVERLIEPLPEYNCRRRPDTWHLTVSLNRLMR